MSVVLRRLDCTLGLLALCRSRARRKKRYASNQPRVRVKQKKFSEVHIHAINCHNTCVKINSLFCHYPQVLVSLNRYNILCSWSPSMANCSQTPTISYCCPPGFPCAKLSISISIIHLCSYSAHGYSANMYMQVGCYGVL